MVITAGYLNPAAPVDLIVTAWKISHKTWQPAPDSILKNLFAASSSVPALKPVMLMEQQMKTQNAVSAIPAVMLPTDLYAAMVPSRVKPPYSYRTQRAPALKLSCVKRMPSEPQPATAESQMTVSQPAVNLRTSSVPNFLGQNCLQTEFKNTLTLT